MRIINTLDVIREHFIASCSVIGIVGILVGYIARRILGEKKIENAERVARKIISDAEKEAEAKIREGALEAKDALIKARADFEKETKERRQELVLWEKRIIQKEENMDRKVDILDKKEQDVTHRERNVLHRERQVKEKQREYTYLLEEQRKRLMRISELTKEEAKKILLSMMEEEVRHEAASMIKQIENEAKAKAEKEAKKIITLAIQRVAADHISETTVTAVALPNDEMKGRIIGREGRNIRALEAATGIDVIIDDTPEAVILSGFDPIRKEIAKGALERLILDGRIHPARIEEVVAKVRKEIEENIREAGEQAVFDLGLQGIHPELIRLLGRLQYRTSYGQNVLQHSKEVAYVMGIMASELGADPKMAKRIGLLHDIGKAVDHEVEGPHAIIGADHAKKYRESPEIVHAIAAHHGEEEPHSILAVLASAGDAISAARPGARAETIEAYIKRLEKLEKIANSFKGVEKSYAIQAGREIRVIVEPTKIDDAEAVQIARNVTKKIQEELDYPGQIKVTVIRETRAIEYAK